MAMSFDRFIRFVDGDDRIVYGNLEQAVPGLDIVGLEVQLLSGDPEKGFTKSSQRAKVEKLLMPLPDTPVVLCSGLNYHEHIKETNATPTTKPVVFMTPPERLTGPLDDIIVHEDAQPMLDYEGELAVVLAKDAKDVSEDEALDYVLGYTVANDVSARNLVAMEIAFHQMGHSKSFDSFGPLGPCVVSPTSIHNPQQLTLVTRVNGEIRQNAHTSDMVWTVKQIIAWTSRNRTLKRGTVLMTGTPCGVGWHSGGLLHHGDTVEIEISEIGSISNKVVFL